MVGFLAGGYDAVPLAIIAPPRHCTWLVAVTISLPLYAWMAERPAFYSMEHCCRRAGMERR